MGNVLADSYQLRNTAYGLPIKACTIPIAASLWCKMNREQELVGSRGKWERAPHDKADVTFHSRSRGNKIGDELGRLDRGRALAIAGSEGDVPRR